MLTAARNEMLTRVGPGTPMGELLRRYWFPVAGASELDKAPIKPVRLLGEDLVLYKDLSGRFGLVDRHCPHRRADLVLWLGRGERHPLQLSRLADGRARPLHRAALRGCRPSESARQGALRHHRLSGARARRSPVGLHGTAAGARAAGVRAVHLAERFSRDRARRHPVQFLPVPGELHRPGAFRMDARQLEPSPRRPRRPQPRSISS